MGLNKNSSAAQWIGLSKGVFAVKNGGYVEEYKSFTGLLVGIGFVDKAANTAKQIPASRQMVLSFQCGSELYKIGINSVSGYGRSIKMKLPMVDLTREFELVPAYKEETKDASCFINQGGIAIKQKWNKDNPGDMPQAIPPKTSSGRWNFEDQEIWLEKYLLNNVGPIAAANLVKPASGQSSGPSSHDEASGEESEDHPEDGAGIPADAESVPF